MKACRKLESGDGDRAFAYKDTLRTMIAFNFRNGSKTITAVTPQEEILLKSGMFGMATASLALLTYTLI